MFVCMDTSHVNVTTLRLANKAELEEDLEIFTPGVGTAKHELIYVAQYEDFTYFE